MSSSAVVRRQKNGKSALQPIDRHLAELGDFDGSIYINAGIDSTCCRKRGRTIHTLTNGIVIDSSQLIRTSRSESIDQSEELITDLIPDNFNDVRFEMINNGNAAK